MRNWEVEERGERDREAKHERKVGGEGREGFREKEKFEVKWLGHV